MKPPKIGSPITGQKEASYMHLGAQRAVRIDSIPDRPNRAQRRQLDKIVHQQRKQIFREVVEEVRQKIPCKRDSR